MPKSLNEKIAEIRTELIKSFPDRVAKINTLTGRLDAEKLDTEAVKALIYQMHNLRGLSGSHGFFVIHEIATNIEQALTTVKEVA